MSIAPALSPRQLARAMVSLAVAGLAVAGCLSQSSQSLTADYFIPEPRADARPHVDRPAPEGDELHTTVVEPRALTPEEANIMRSVHVMVAAGHLQAATYYLHGVRESRPEAEAVTLLLLVRIHLMRGDTREAVRCVEELQMRGTVSRPGLERTGDFWLPGEFQRLFRERGIRGPAEQTERAVR